MSKYLCEIVDITYLPTEKYGIDESEKRVFFDIACTDTCGREFIIEMQHARQPEFVERSIYYLSRAISSGMKSGVVHYRIIPTYSVNLLDYELPEYECSKECFSAVFFKDHNNRILTPEVGVFYLNLCNFAVQQEDVSLELLQWLYVLKNMQYFDEADYEKQEGVFRNLLDECRISKMSKMEKENYEKSVLEYEDVQASIAYAKELAAEKAYGKGIKEGMEKGIQQATTSLVLNMRKTGMDIATIPSVTGLTEEEIFKIIE